MVYHRGMKINTKAEIMFADLLSELNRLEVDYDQLTTEIVVFSSDLTLEVWNGKYIGGTYSYDSSCDAGNLSNVGCPEFDNINDAISWANS